MKKGIKYNIFFLTAVFLIAFRAMSQDLEPRLSAMAPAGLHIAVASYMYSNGNVLTDITLPIEDLNASIHTAALGYAGTFKLFGMLNKFDAIVNYNNANWDLYVDQNDTSARRVGFGDALIRWGIVFVGSPAYTPSEYANAELKKFRMAFGIRIRLPIGQYDPNYFFNIGMNRWGFKTALTAGYQAKKMLFETKVAAWFFTANNNFYGGNVMKQSPVYSLQFHWSYVFKPGLWVSASFDVYRGGKLSLNGGEYKNILENTRLGLALSIPLAKQHTIKLAYNVGASSRFGANFNTLSIAYQFMWTRKQN